MVQLVEADLSDRHSGSELDWNAIVVLDLESDGSFETRIDEPSRNMGGESKATQRRLAFESGSDVVR